MGKDEASGSLYDGDLVFDNGTYLINESRRTVEPGFFKTLAGVAKEVGEILSEATKDLGIFKEDIQIMYHSDVHDGSGDGSRGYTDHTGSYLRRPLDDSEMRELIGAVDKKVRRMLYERK